MKKDKSNSFAYVNRTFLIMVCLPLVAVFTGSTHGLAYAQERCIGEHTAWVNEQNVLYTFITATLDSEEQVQRALWSASKAAHELSALRARIPDIDSLEIFIPDPSPQRTQMENLRKSFENRVKVLTEQENRARSELISSIEDWTRKNEIQETAERRIEDAESRYRKCLASTSGAPPVITSSQPPDVRGITVRLVDVATNPKGTTPYGGWTWPANGGSIDYSNPSVGHQTFQWTTPARQIGPEGFSMTLDVQSRSNPNSRALAGISVRGGDFVLTPNPAHAEALSENQQLARKSLTVTLKPPQNFSGRDIYLIVGADYGPSFIYHYEVIR